MFISEPLVYTLRLNNTFSFADFLDKPHDEVAGTNEWIDEMSPCIREWTSKLGLEEMWNTFYHEIDNRLRRIDDAVRIRDLNRESPEKLLVYGIEEVLFLREVDEGWGGTFNRSVEGLG